MLRAIFYTGMCLLLLGVSACSGELKPVAPIQDLHYSQLEGLSDSPRLELKVENVYGGTDSLVGSVNSGGQVVFQGDMVIGVKAGLATQAAGVSSRKWPNNTVPFTVNRQLMPEVQQEQLDAAVEHFNANTPLRWVEVFEDEGVEGQDVEDPFELYGNFVEIRDSGLGECNSFVGMIDGTVGDAPRGGQPLNFSSWCGYRGILHEMGHAIGLHHEHLRQDRNGYINLNCAVLACQDAAWTVRQEAEPFGPYDYYSIMHYSAYIDNNDDGVIDDDDLQVMYPLKPGVDVLRIGQEAELSDMDVKAISKLYGAMLEPTSPEPAVDSFVSTIVAHHSRKCVDVPGWLREENGAQLMQWDCHYRDNQRFDFQEVEGKPDVYTIRSLYSGKCIEVAARDHANGAAVVQADCTNDRNQQFKLRAKDSGGYQVVAKHSNKCLDVQDKLEENAAKLRQWYCYAKAEEIANQVFYLDGRP